MFCRQFLFEHVFCFSFEFKYPFSWWVDLFRVWFEQLLSMTPVYVGIYIYLGTFMYILTSNGKVSSTSNQTETRLWSVSHVRGTHSILPYVIRCAMCPQSFQVGPFPHNCQRLGLIPLDIQTPTEKVSWTPKIYLKHLSQVIQSDLFIP